MDSELSSTRIGHDIIGFALVAFLITVIFIVISLSYAGPSYASEIDCRFNPAPGADNAAPGYRLDSELSSTRIGHDIMGFALVAFLITVIFICNLLSCAGHVMCQRNDC